MGIKDFLGLGSVGTRLPRGFGRRVQSAPIDHLVESDDKTFATPIDHLLGGEGGPKLPGTGPRPDTAPPYEHYFPESPDEPASDPVDAGGSQEEESAPPTDHLLGDEDGNDTTGPDE